MKRLIIILSLAFVSCNPKPTKKELEIIGKDYKYEIHGIVKTIHGDKKAIWLTDTLSMNGDTIYYFNTDGTKVEILPPYKIKCKTK